MAFSLEGIKVIETATVYAGPMASRLLSDWGADVIKIENPMSADIARAGRSRVQRVAMASGRTIFSDIPYVTENLNYNKRGMTLNLAQDSGREIFHRLLEKADVLVTNQLPNVLKKLKLDYETLSQINPRLIQANFTSYGKKGPDKDMGAVDYTGYWARSGYSHVIQKVGMPPIMSPSGSGDSVAALAIAFGIMTALYLRERTGVGQEVDTSLYQSGVFTIFVDIGGALVTGQDRQEIDRKDMLNVLGTTYQTKDGKWLRFHILAENLWPTFCQAIERPDLEHDPRFASFELRIENHAALLDVVEQVFLAKTMDEWKVRLSDTNLNWGPLQSLPEVITDPQARANDFFIACDHPTHGRIEYVANPVHLSNTPQKAIRMPAPEVGQHTEEILLEYGYTWEDIGRFKEQGVIA